MKKLLFIIALIIIIIPIAGYQITAYRCKNLQYAVQKSMTSGIFNKDKLYKVDNYMLSFSDGSMALVKVQGIKSSAPHDRAAYNVLMEKSKNGVWKKRKVYPTQYVIKGDE